MARFFLTLSYDGRGFNGWQIQENTANTVEQLLEEKMGMLLKEKVDLVGCGRTDTGVNARNFVAHFNCGLPDLIQNKKHWIYKFNTVLPATVAVHDIRLVDEDAHARYDATQRTYYYYLSLKKDPFREGFSYQVHGELDFEAMNEAAAILMEYNDFTSFSKSRTQNKTNLCKITKAQWHMFGERQWRFTISADRFLRGMVRGVVGTLLLVGQNKITLSDFRKIIELKDRKLAGSNVPAKALFLVGIKYPKKIFND